MGAPKLDPLWSPVSPRAGAALAAAMSPGSGGSAHLGKGPWGALGTVQKAPLRVLVVESSPSERRLLELGLSRARFEVTAVADAAAAWSVLSSEPVLPGLVVADSALEFEGTPLATLLRQDPRTRELPLILLTGSSAAAQRELVSGLGPDEILPRPLFIQDVVTLARLKSGYPASQKRFELTTEELPLPSLLRALLGGIRAGRVDVASGSVVFKKGRVLEARFEKTEGEAALVRLLLLARGAYSVAFLPGADGPMFLSNRELCSTLLPQVRQWERALSAGVALEARYALDFKRLLKVQTQLPRGIENVIRLADGHRTVRQIVLESPLEPVTSLQVLTRLVQLEVVTRLDPPAPRAVKNDLSPALAHQLEAFQIKTLVEEGPTLPSTRLPPPPAAAPVPQPLPGEAPTYVPGSLGSVLSKPASSSPVQTPAPPLSYEGPTLVPEPTAPPAPAVPPSAAPSSSEEEAEQAFFSDEELAWAKPRLRLKLPSPRVLASCLGALALVGVVALGVSVARSAKRAAVPLAARIPLTVPAAQPKGPADNYEAVTPATLARLRAATDLYQAGKAKEAAQVLEELTRDHPQLPDGWVALALARFDSGDSKAAEAAAQKALALNPREPRAHLLLASIDLVRKDLPDARRELKRYLAIDPQGTFADEAKSLLETVGEDGSSR